MKRRVRPGVERLDARTLLSGGLDPTFGVGGTVVRDFRDNNMLDIARALAVQPDGKVLVGASVVRPDGSTRTDFGIARYLPGGAIDPTFGANGLATVDFSGNFDDIRKLLVQPDGRILAFGTAQMPGKGTLQDDLGIARLLPDGRLDTTFGGGRSPTGKVTVDLSNFDSLNDAGLDSRGRIVLAGSGATYDSKLRSYFHFNTLVRLNVNGAVDTSFGASGRALGASGRYSYDRWDALQIGAGDTIAVVGRDGAVDATARFSASGVRQFRAALAAPINPYDPATRLELGLASRVAFGPDGRFVATGAAGREAIGADVFVIRYLANGQRDATFGSDGVVLTALLGPEGQRTFEDPAAIAIGPDGRIVVAAQTTVELSTTVPNPSDTLLLRYNPDGSPDDGSAADSTPGDRFGTGGRIVASLGPNLKEDVDFVTVLPDGKILTAGNADYGTAIDANGQRIEDRDVVLARFDGTVLTAAPAPAAATTMTATATRTAEVFVPPTEANGLVVVPSRRPRRAGFVVR
jgi:uncharacterized delta-60 repeat protein